MKLWDATGGFKCFRRRVLAAIDLKDVRSNGYAFQIEMSFRAFRKGFKGIEIPIVFSDRTHGQSKMNKGIMVEAIRIPWLLRWWTIVGRTGTMSIPNGRKFWKMSGSGNDFLFFDARTDPPGVFRRPR